MNAATTLPDHAAILCREVTDIPRVLGYLGLPLLPEGRGYKIPCPWHPENTPSCAVSIGPEGTLRAFCFACRQGGNVLHLVAQVRGLDMRRDFFAILDETARAGGVSLDAGPRGLLGSGRVVGPTAPARSVPAPLPPSLPPAAEVAALWGACLPVTADPEAVAGLQARAIDPAQVDLFDLARVLPAGASRPRWARHWTPAHRLIVPAYDARGGLASLRARRTDGTSAAPKVLVPGGHTDHGTLLACSNAVALLTEGQPSHARRVVITEGEPDFLTAAASVSDADDSLPATLGVFAGSWSADFAGRIPDGSTVDILTHDDHAGHKYAASIYHTLAARYAAGRLAIIMQPGAVAYLENLP